MVDKGITAILQTFKQFCRHCMQEIEDKYEGDIRQYVYDVITTKYKLQLDSEDIPEVFTKKSMNKFLRTLIHKNKDKQQTVLDCIDYLYKVGHCVSTLSSLSISLEDFLELDEERTRMVQEIKKTPNVLQKNMLLDKYYQELKEKLKANRNALVQIVDGGVRASDTQLRQMLLARGFIEVSPGKLVFVDDNYLDGLSINSIVKSGEAARKALYDKAVSTFEPGYLTRQFIYNLSHVRFTQEDCGSRDYLLYKLTEDNFKNFVGRYYYDIKTQQEKLLSESDKHLIGHIVPFRSVIHCKAEDGICRRCFGRWYYEEYDEIGIITAQTLGERGVQLTLRVFHTGSAVNISNIYSSLLQKYTDYLALDKNIITVVKPVHVKFTNPPFTVKKVLLNETQMLLLDPDSNQVVVELPLSTGYQLFVDKNQSNYMGHLFAINYESVVNSIKLLKKIISSKIILQTDKDLMNLINVLYNLLSFGESIPMSMIELLVMVQLMSKNDKPYFYDRVFEFPMVKQSVKIIPHILGIGLLFERAGMSFIYHVRDIKIDSRLIDVAEGKK